MRFGSALNLNIHFHMLWLDGVYENVEQPQCKPRLRRARAPTFAQLTQLADFIARRVCRHLSRQGWLEGQKDSAFLSERAGGDDKTDYGNAVWHPLNTHRTDKSNSNKMDNTMISNSLKAQGKGIMHPVLTEVSLRRGQQARSERHLIHTHASKRTHRNEHDFTAGAKR